MNRTIFTAISLLLPVAICPGQEFRFDRSSTVEKLWGGRGLRIRPAFFDELLPALFERTLVLSKCDLAGGRLAWIFTGERGGFTVELTEGKISLQQVFYDSYGLYPAEAGAGKFQRHPERIWQTSVQEFPGGARSIAVALDHKLSLRLKLNGADVAQQRFVLDVSRHQLVYTPAGSQIGAVEGMLKSPPVRNVTVRVDQARKHQTMLGFGGITTPAAYRGLSQEGRRKWWRLVQEYNLLLQREYPMGHRLLPDMSNLDRLSDATPHYYGDNFPNGEVTDFEYIRALRKLGGKVIYEFWDLPPWARQDWKDAQGKRHTGVAEPRKYAEAMARYCRISRERAGAPPDIAGVQNEISQPPEIFRQMTLELRRALDEAGLRGVKIHSTNPARLYATGHSGITTLRALRQFTDAWNLTDYSATNMYDYQDVFHDPDRFDALLREWREIVAGKPFLAIELCVNRAEFQLDTYRIAFAMAQLYHKNLTIADAVALVYCWTLLNVEQPSYGWTRSLFVPSLRHGLAPAASSHQLRTFGAYSRRVNEGMTRVETTTDEGVLAAAFMNAKGGKTVVLLNRGGAPAQVTVEWPGAAFTSMELADPYNENTARSASGKSVVIAPGAIVTLAGGAAAAR